VAICDFPACVEDVQAGEPFCALHRERLDFLLTVLEIRCPTCGSLTPEGLIRHQCSQRQPSLR